MQQFAPREILSLGSHLVHTSVGLPSELRPPQYRRSVEEVALSGDCPVLYQGPHCKTYCPTRRAHSSGVTAEAAQ